MANYVINNKTNSFIIIKGNNSNPYSRNDLRISFSSDNNQILKIYDKTVNKYLLYDIDLNIDTVDVDGLTVFADTQSLYDALEPIFFLISSGSGGSSLQERIIVNQDNFTTTLGGVIDSTKEYFLDGFIDTGTTSITIPVNGLNLTGYNFNVSGLFSTEDNYTMFVSESIAIGSGNLIGKDYDINVSGTNSKVYELYDATGFNAFEFARINFSNCTSLGDIYDYRQGLESGTGRFGGSPSLTLHGLWRGGYRVVTSIVRSMSDTTTEPLFKAGNLFQMNSRFNTDANIDLGDLQPLLDFSPVNFPNPSTLQLQEMILTRGGVLNPEDTNITPNIESSDLASYWKDNNGINNTYVGASSSVISEELTVIGAGSTWYDLEGIFLTTGDVHYSGNADGELTHDGISPREFEFTSSLTIEGQSNNELTIRFMKYDNATSSFTPLDYTETTRPINALVGGRDVAFFNVIYGGTLDQGDYLKLQVRNNSGNQNVTLETGSYFRIQER
jgi:hypothetical protein